METQHPSVEQLIGFMESPEIGTHSNIRRHLMACDSCRRQVDKFSQLEMNIKHHVPRFTSQHTVVENTGQMIERFVDQQLDDEQHQLIQHRINSDPRVLKSALHYAVHSAAMSRNLDALKNKPLTTGISSTTSRQGLIHRWLRQMKQSLQSPMPTWALAPASIAIAAIVSLALVSHSVSHQPQAQIAAYQDDPRITFERAGMPSGSIGFFHDAQSSSKPFSGIKIAVNQTPGENGEVGNQQLVFEWPTIDTATDYQLSIYTYQDNDRQLLARQSSDKSQLIFSDLNLANRQHYQWELSGVTKNGLKFRTTGDFVYLDNRQQ
ncbi:hypothetical protein [Kaarinaea lacus]